jgi:NAD(P)-dependent dehydrogenase (short-subunit alcohol dehydrogenase family)
MEKILGGRGRALFGHSSLPGNDLIAITRAGSTFNNIWRCTMDIRFDGKVALVTGGGSGIGREVARLFAEAGARVALSDAHEAGGQETVDMIRQAGHEASFVTCDVTDEDSVRRWVGSVKNEFGHINVAVNAAGVSGPGTIETTSSETFDFMMKVNVYGLWYSMRHEVPAILEAGGGAIVNIVSNNAVAVTPGAAAYGTSKWAALGLTKSAGIELAGKGIRVNAVGPGATDTPMIARLAETAPEMLGGILAQIPDGRMGEAIEPAYAAVFLCSDFARHINSEQITVDGGQFARL